ncbi:MAG: AAA-like domain-containing protein [Lachnospiraceae bacterium]|nr:AAA-like domain-containing protein [Lachnospiraceae bacterium]
MAKTFNITGACFPKLHYMVNLSERLEKIRKMVDSGSYFTINRGRQYGKTTTLLSLIDYLGNNYEVVFLDFQELDSSSYADTASFVAAVSSMLLFTVDNLPDGVRRQLTAFEEGTETIVSFQKLFQTFTLWCRESEKPIVLLIDEVDTATNNQVFLDFLAQLRSAYLARNRKPAFQSVILAGVHDVQNIKRKIRPDEEHKENSPWNIAAKFNVEMNFSAEEICKMLQTYEEDWHTDMDTEAISQMIYDYTSGYPVLVSNICKILDEELAGTKNFPDKADAWTKNGILQAVNIILTDASPLFGSLIDKINTYAELRNVLFDILMNGAEITYNPDLASIHLAMMYGFIRREDTLVVIANRIFETRLYNYFLSSEKERKSEMYRLGEREKYHFIQNGELNMDTILERFVVSFDDLYGDRGERFIEDDGRRYFLLYLRPLINGIGNYYIEARTRNSERTDVIIDYLGKQTIVELKIWRGNSYNQRGEKQLCDYLDYYHLDKGYMLSFCFNKNKKIGLHEIHLKDKLLVEAVV